MRARNTEPRNDPTVRGKRLVARFAAVQLAAALLMALVIAVVAVGNLVFGWRLFSPGVAPAARIARAMWVGEGLKWIWVVLAVWLALAVAGLAPLPFLLGMLAGQVGFWIGVAYLR
jgi:hypothetical protein